MATRRLQNSVANTEQRPNTTITMIPYNANNNHLLCKRKKPVCTTTATPTITTQMGPLGWATRLPLDTGANQNSGMSTSQAEHAMHNTTWQSTAQRRNTTIDKDKQLKIRWRWSWSTKRKNRQTEAKKLLKSLNLLLMDYLINYPDPPPAWIGAETNFPMDTPPWTIKRGDGGCAWRNEVPMLAGRYQICKPTSTPHGCASWLRGRS